MARGGKSSTDPTAEIVQLDAPARRARLVLFSFPIAVLLVIGGARLIVTSHPVRSLIAESIARKIAKRSGAAVRIGEISFGWAYQPCIDRIELRQPERLGFDASIRAERACVDRWASAIGSGFRAVRITLEQPSIQIRGHSNGSGARSLVDVSPEPPHPGAGTESETPLVEIEIAFDELRLDWGGLPLPAGLGTGSLGPLDGALSVQHRGSESAVSIEVHEPRSGLFGRGRAAPTPAGWDLSLQVEGDVAPSFGGFVGSMTGLDVRTLPVHGQVGAVYDRTEQRLDLAIDLEQSRVDIGNDLVSSRRLVGFRAREKADVSLDLDEPKLHLEHGLFEVNGVPLLISLAVAPGEKSPVFSLRSDLRTIALDRLLRSIPGADQGGILEGLRPDVLIAMSFTVAGEIGAPESWQPEIEYSIVGIGDEGMGSGLEYLRSPFDYHPLTKTGRREAPLRTGPKTAGWMSYGSIPVALRRAVQVSEDASFFVHRGIDLDEVRAAIVESMNGDKRGRGGSTISQQLAKNLFLSRERTAMRKLQELLLTFLLESSFTKPELFELYLNLIEWGPNVYGLYRASQHYFHRPPGELNPKEMAYLATIIPAPSRFHKSLTRRSLSQSHEARLDRVLERLHRIEALSDEDLEAARAAPLRWRGEATEAESEK